jgi:hypothetical protein
MTRRKGQSWRWTSNALLVVLFGALLPGGDHGFAVGTPLAFAKESCGEVAKVYLEDVEGGGLAGVKVSGAGNKGVKGIPVDSLEDEGEENFSKVVAQVMALAGNLKRCAGPKGLDVLRGPKGVMPICEFGCDDGLARII